MRGAENINDLTLSQQDALLALRGRLSAAKKSSARTKTIVFFGPVTEVGGDYVDLKDQVAAVLACDGGERLFFDDHLDGFLESLGLTHDPSRLEGTSVCNYLYEICGRVAGDFLVVDQVNTTLRLLSQSTTPSGAQQALLMKRLHQVMFPKPVVMVFPLFPEPRWLTKEQVIDLCPSPEKWVYLEDSEMDRAYLRERSQAATESVADKGRR